jgi:tetratricopeptide (TPR) repeat protein
MTVSRFDSDRWSLEAARDLPADCFDDFQRLSRTLIHGPQFQWLLVDASDERLRKRVMAALDQVLSAAGLRISRLHLGRSIVDVPTLEARLIKHARQSDIVHVIVPRAWFDAARWDAFNVRRERIAAQARARLVFWLDADAIAAASRGAPDLWAWRGGVYSFVSAPFVMDGGFGRPSVEHLRVAERETGIDTRSMAERHRRIAEIRAWIESHPDVDDELLIAPFQELGWLYFDLGDYDAALAHWRDRQLPLHQRRGDDRAAAITRSEIADVLLARGDLEGALLIHRNEILPVVERLDDVKGRAVTQGKIANILEARGELEEALRIRREEELPVYERLGDVRARAITQGQIADILQARGELEEALRIRREEELPVYERLGDVRSRAIAQGQIADILQARGELEEALRIRREEQMPVYERLGDVRERAITQSKIADILQARGELEEALRIRREEVLPVLDRLGDVRSHAIMHGKIADILQARGELEEALRIRREEELPVYERLGDVRARAITQGQIADILQARGELEEALRIRREEALPMYERLGDVRALMVERANLALALHKRGYSEDRPEIHTLLQQALTDAERLRLPEAQTIRDWIAQIFGPEASPPAA